MKLMLAGEDTSQGALKKAVVPEPSVSDNAGYNDKKQCCNSHTRYITLRVKPNEGNILTRNMNEGECIAS